jgi:hypothetical protein
MSRLNSSGFWAALGGVEGLEELGMVRAARLGGRYGFDNEERSSWRMRVD